jgi:FkbM family methyltransferase
MQSNILASKTIEYIWTHPNCKSKKIRSILRFFGWQFYKRLTNKTITIPLTLNIKMYCYPDSRSAASVLYCGLYDYHEMNFILRFLRREDSFIDIGANVGVYTLLAASQLNASSLYSFEALPKNYNRLLQNLELNGLQQVRTHQLAISNSQGYVTLYVSDGDSTPSITSHQGKNTVQVESNTLNNFSKTLPLDRLTLGKIDIEGAELLAFQGANLLFEKQIPVVWILEILGKDNQELVNFLHNYGYSLYQYNADTNTLHQIELANKQGNNVLAIADGAIEWVRDRLCP